MLLASCSPPPIEVTVEAVRGLHLVTLRQDWGLIFRDRKAPCIRHVWLYPRDETAPAVWALTATGDVQCADLGDFRIGAIPAGFSETKRLPLNARGRHKLVVGGIGWGEAELTL